MRMRIARVCPLQLHIIYPLVVFTPFPPGRSSHEPAWSQPTFQDTKHPTSYTVVGTSTSSNNKSIFVCTARHDARKPADPDPSRSTHPHVAQYEKESPPLRQMVLRGHASSSQRSGSMCSGSDLRMLSLPCTPGTCMLGTPRGPASEASHAFHGERGPLQGGRDLCLLRRFD